MFQGVVTDVKPVVSAVEPGSMAQEVGIRPGDRIVALDGSPVKAWDGFQRQMVDREPGEKVSVTVVRDGSQKTFEGELGADPQGQTARASGREAGDRNYHLRSREITRSRRAEVRGDHGQARALSSGSS